MRFSDSTQFNIPKPIKYANSDFSLFNSDKTISDEDSSTSFNSSFKTSNCHPTSSSSNDNSSIKLFDYSPFKKINTTPHTDIPIDRSRHKSHNQSNPLPSHIDRTTKTQYQLRQQPKIDYSLFIPPSKL